MSQLSFGAGVLWGERVDATGDGIGPVQFGIMQGAEVDFEWDTKTLFGENQFPEAIARGQCKISGKFTNARILGSALSDIVFGETSVAGQLGVARNEAASVPADPGPYTKTVANAATYNDDLGVYYVSTGLPFKRVATVAAAGEYSVALDTGIYTFDAADAGVALLISYTYDISASGKKLTISNQLSGVTPVFKTTLYQSVSPGQLGGVGPKPLSLRLNACVLSKFTFATKVDDWTIPETDFMAFADQSGDVGYFSTVE